MKSNAVHFITSGIAACCLFMCAAAAGAKTNAVEKTAATSVAKVDDAAAKAATEAKAAAEKGGAEAQFRYAEMLRDGRGVAKNMKQAAHVITPSDAKAASAVTNCVKELAENGDAAAQFSIAKPYHNPHHPAAYDYLLQNMWNIASMIIALAALMITCYEFYKISKKNAYDLRAKEIQAIMKPLSRLIKKNQCLNEICEQCLMVGGWKKHAASITGFMNTPAYEDLLESLIDILDAEALNVIVFPSKTRTGIRRLMERMEELDGLIVIVTDPETFKPQEIMKQICNIKEEWLRLAKLLAKDLMLNKKEASEFFKAAIDYANSLEV